MGYFTFSYDLKDSTKSSEDIIRRKLINLIHPYSKNILERGVATTFVFDSIKSIGQLHAKISDELGNEIYFYLSEIKTTNELFLKKQINEELNKNFQEIVEEEFHKRKNEDLDFI